MRWSRYYLYTTREVPNDAEVISHQLMVRAGLIKKVAAGIYTYLPFGWRSLAKLMAIVRRELDAISAAELTMPAIQPAELWQESGRWQRYGKELLRIKDRHERDFVFGPTHEEVITDIVRRDVKSYRQLPISLYQIQTKFRDEIRPRFGLMRGREFIMKDAYSFHASPESLDVTYDDMRRAYCKIFEACQLDYTVVEADTGSIGGSASHEFMVVAETGESAVVRCPKCGYAANVEKAQMRKLDAEAAIPKSTERKKVPTPGKSSVEDVAAFLRVAPRQVVKTLIYDTEKGLVAVVVRGDREINEVKLLNHLDVEHLALASEEKVREATGAAVGFAGPVGLSAGVRLIGDETVRGLADFVVGANEGDAHYTGVNWGTDVDLTEWADLLLVSGGDPCPRCDGTLEIFRGIEVGHIFKLGTKYSKAMACNYTDESGGDHPMIMGCYGLGIGRTVAAAIEQNHDKDGIIWPRPLAPFEVLLAGLNPDDPEVSRVTEELYAELRGQGVEVLYDDRDERPGVKFKDADLIGIPVRLVIGAKSLKDGKVEVSLRRDREKLLVPPGDAVGRVLELLAKA
ncbi:MAG: prolyl-tRNA synthetase [Acidobacteriota bacterium]|jgi:prolyl-tRNA synthetase|nr:prolyl-tRNA synthetase [Acidobacteriota bacterium]